jgi:hypothetical protein
MFQALLCRGVCQDRRGRKAASGYFSTSSERATSRNALNAYEAAIDAARLEAVFAIAPWLAGVVICLAGLSSGPRCKGQVCGVCSSVTTATTFWCVPKAGLSTPSPVVAHFDARCNVFSGVCHGLEL